MLEYSQFKKRAHDLWSSQQKMASARKWQSGKKIGMIRREAVRIEFAEEQWTRWLWDSVGLNAIACPYCGVPIDILSVVPDHIAPRSAGGRFTLSNMQCICKECNERKGNMSHGAYAALLRFALTELSPYDQGVLLARLKAAHAGSANRFFRDKSKEQPTSQPPPRTPAKQDRMNFELGSF